MKRLTPGRRGHTRGAGTHSTVGGHIVVLAAILAAVCAAQRGGAEAAFPPPTNIVVTDDKEDLSGTQLQVICHPVAKPAPAGWELVAYACWSLEEGKEPKLEELIVPPFPETIKCTASGLLPNHSYSIRVDALYVPKGVDWVIPGHKPVTEGRLAPEVAVVVRGQVPVVDLAAVAEAAGAELNWDGARHTATVKLAGKQLRVTLGEAALTVDGKPVALPCAVQVRDGRLEVPVVPLAAALGMPVGKPFEPRLASVESSEAVKPVGSWYDPKLTNRLVGVVVICGIFLGALFFARRREMYIRPIAGLEAVNDAIGRATEMGRPILYISGLGGVSDIATIASMLILGHLAKRTAAYETDILVPCNEPLVMAAEREIVREAYLEAGRPDAYKQDNIFYITDSQFSYVAAVDGIMMRERPAANFYMGYFAAESLILAETGNYTGAIQIAGTDADTQLPFFITACDHTLMGEELYAAGAYLSRAPVLLAQLKGQDIGKVMMIVVLVAGVIAATVTGFVENSWLSAFVELFKTR